jgi:hypothetical protein
MDHSGGVVIQVPELQPLAESAVIVGFGHVVRSCGKARPGGSELATADPVPGWAGRRQFEALAHAHDHRPAGAGGGSRRVKNEVRVHGDPDCNTSTVHSSTAGILWLRRYHETQDGHEGMRQIAIPVCA